MMQMTQMSIAKISGTVLASKLSNKNIVNLFNLPAVTMMEENDRFAVGNTVVRIHRRINSNVWIMVIH